MRQAAARRRWAESLRLLSLTFRAFSFDDRPLPHRLDYAIVSRPIFGRLDDGKKKAACRRRRSIIGCTVLITSTSEQKMMPRRRRCARIRFKASRQQRSALESCAAQRLKPLPAPPAIRRRRRIDARQPLMLQLSVKMLVMMAGTAYARRTSELPARKPIPPSRHGAPLFHAATMSANARSLGKESKARAATPLSIACARATSAASCCCRRQELRHVTDQATAARHCQTHEYRAGQKWLRP